MKTPSRIASFTGCAVILIAISAPIVAAPPADLDPNSAASEWFKSLRQPGTSLPCCSISDCRRLDFRIANDGRYEVLRPEDNRVGRAVACYTTIFGYGTLRGNGTYDGDRIEILCFVPERPVSSQQLLNVDA
jgi:hypothetical protein